jgi:hypothetical protein
VKLRLRRNQVQGRPVLVPLLENGLVHVVQCGEDALKAVRRFQNGLELPATTLARITGHADAGFTLRVYARDSRDEAAVVSDVLGRAKRAGVGA